jgi:alpha-beta hydrolase superfamily lysophospholipase|tara:strand:+ start:212 stop:556 length:345 start_codon:yes stop_codon:yes gene_type:complete
MWKKFNNKIKKIIMKNKIYHAERDGWTYPVTKQLILDGRKNRVLNNKNSLKIPVTLFHSLNDMVISLSFSKKILKKFKKAKKRLIRIKGGDHSLSREGDLKKICLELKKMINSV